MAKRGLSVKAMESAIREVAMTYPETTEDFPWGHCAFKVRGKIFVTASHDGDAFTMSVKLPRSQAMALELPFCEPTHYGMGKHGWVTACFTAGGELPMSMIRAWIAESFTAVAPKRLVEAWLAAGGTGKASPARATPAAAKTTRVARPARAATTKTVAAASPRSRASAPATKRKAPPAPRKKSASRKKN